MTPVTNLNRLKLELNNVSYYEEGSYRIFLAENALNPDSDYDYGHDKRKLLQTVLAILQSLSNNVDYFRSIVTEFTTESQAYKWLSQRMTQIEKQILALPDDEGAKISVWSNLFHD